jgi:HEAT repeat protein
LIPLLKDTDAETRRLAAYVLGEIGPQAKAALPGLKELLKDPDRQVVMQAVNSVRSVDPTASDMKNVTVSGE